MLGTHPSHLSEKLCICEIPPDLGHCAGGKAFAETVSLPFLPVSMWPLFLVVEDRFS